MTKRIHFSELERLLADDNTPDAVLAPYLKPAQLRALPLAPILTVDETKVELPASRGIFGLTIKSLTDRANRNRLAAYEAKISGGWKGPRLLAEGDSWFLYPILLKDVLDNLSNDFAIYSVASAGDTLENVMRGAAQLEALIEEHKFDGFLLSAGGNDIAGDMLRTYLTVQRPPANVASYLGNSLDVFLADTQQKLEGLFGGFARRFPDLKIFCHGYDWPFPRLGGLWLAPALMVQQVPSAVQAAVLKLMIDRYYQMLGSLADKYRGRVHLVDCRGSIGDIKEWFDELHPLNPGYARVAGRFRSVINQAFGISAAAGSRAGGTGGVKITWYPNKQAKGGIRESAEFHPGAVVTIGRSSESTIALEDERASRNHARLEIRAADVVFTDLNSTNGSLLEGRRWTGPTTWRAGQRLQIGDHLFELALVRQEARTVVNPLVETFEAEDTNVSLNQQPAKHPLDDYEATRELGQSAGAQESPRDRSSEVRIAKSLDVLRAEINRLAPNRNKSSDGWVGDASHQSRDSDHNPWVRDQGAGVVTALDITHDPTHGCDAGAFAETLRSGKDPRIKYIIWNRRIANSSAIGGKAAWEWRPYRGANPHDHHFHISVKPEKASYDSEAPWLAGLPAPAVV